MTKELDTCELLGHPFLISWPCYLWSSALLTTFVFSQLACTSLTGLFEAWVARRLASWLAGLRFEGMCILRLFHLLYLNWLENPKKWFGKNSVSSKGQKFTFWGKFDQKVIFFTIYSQKFENSTGSRFLSANLGLGKFLVSLIWSLHHEDK